MSVKAFASSWVFICQILPLLGPSPVTYGLYCDGFKRALPPRDTAPRGMIVAHLSSNKGPKADMPVAETNVVNLTTSGRPV
jgi:hypothetical protein